MKKIAKFDSKKGKVTFQVNKGEYDYVRRFADEHEKDFRRQCGMLKTFLIIKLYSLLYRTRSGYVKIHSTVFKDSMSDKNYKAYRDLLKSGNIIDFEYGKRTTYEDFYTGETRFASAPMKFRTLTMSNMSQKTIFFSDKMTSVTVDLPTDVCKSLELKNRFIKEIKATVKDKNKVQKRIDEIQEVDDHSIIATSLLVKFIEDLHAGKINARSTWSSRLKRMWDDTHTSKSTSQESFSMSKSAYEYLIFSIVKNITEIRNNNNHLIEHITDSFLSKQTKNQIVKSNKKLTKTLQKTEFGFYQDLSVGIEGLKFCYFWRDMLHIARINEIPNFKQDGKLYSALANIRREVRKHVHYKDEPIVEVSDITSAHYTMLPSIFEKCGIEIPAYEMNEYKMLTQNGDLYSAVAKGSQFSRNEIKPVFQSFFSIKSEEQYLFHENEDLPQRKLICKYFKENFPEIYRNLIEFHNNQSEVTIKSIANEVESDIMNPICYRIMEEGLHPFRVHDAIYMTQSEYERSSTDIRDMVFFPINNPNPECKPLF